MNNLIARAVKQERIAQTELYQRYAPKMLAVCRMYTKDLQFAEDVMVRGFLKAFKNIESFQNNGSFEGWLRRIMTREAIDFLRAHKALDFPENFEHTLAQSEAIKAVEKQHNEAHLQWYIDQLPNGYREVFLLYAVEGYAHKEIAEKVGISESTSKSQLHKARKHLQKMMQQDVNNNKEVSYGR